VISTRTACRKRASVGAAALAVAALPAFAADWSGSVGVEARYFAHDPLYPGQHGGNLSFVIDAEFYHDWDDGDQRIVFSPFVRVDQGDPERTHADLRELYWRRSFESAELAIGLKKIFWGVTESQHLVDIINQTDFVENVDTEDKLGQPMVHLRLLKDWGTLDFFALPYFRERTFPGPKGRLRPPIPVATDEAMYESGDEENHFDFAVRWSHYIGDYDIGIAHFSGTGRDPKLTPLISATGEPLLIPFYEQIEQTSLDLQATKGDWLWKLELISRDEPAGRFTAVAAGFEYTFVGVFDSAIDVGVVAEYLFDDRPVPTTNADNDIVIGARFAFNDEQDTQLLAFSGIDADTQASFTSVEGSRRFGQNWRLSLEARIFSNFESAELLYPIRDDDYVELTLARYF
jgi:hypothetical protein